MKLQPLGNTTPRAFLRGHWQKRPLLVRGALPAALDIVDFSTLRALAARDDVESRVVERRGSRWETHHGPFKKASLRKTNATLLVSGVNLHVAAAESLLRRFSFIPQARLDDVMVSYATPGGGVGPHVDSYDVFLVQGPGRRRWRVWNSKNKVIQYVVGPGDLLYLPPGLKHDGVALDPCFTYSVGFRAPRGAELAAAFLDWLHERGLPDARYADPRLAPVRRNAAIPREMVSFSEKILSSIKWSRGDVAVFLGEYLSAPKAHVVFRPSRTRGAELRLDPKTQLLYSGKRFFMNGESFVAPKRAAANLRVLADRRRLPAARLAGRGLTALISAWLRAGYAHLHRLKEPTGQMP
jgi:50S ribosomal protein L16 3-hydroxylase